MISKTMTRALNEQINRELFSAYLYQAMSSQSAHEGNNGFATWFRIQAQEEAGHALKFYKYLQDQGAKVEWKAIAAPPATFKSPLAMVEAVLEHERFITASIRELVDLALKEKDYATQIMLQWFVTEQIEEESAAENVLNKVRLLGGEARGLYLLDKELGARQAH
ncbi:MAG: ferritin [Kiritimatiellia bacterium]|nr:ferritin [Kiritimatiellia bacterium]